MKFRVFSKDTWQYDTTSNFMLDKYGLLYVANVQGNYFVVQSDYIIEYSTGVFDCAGKEIFAGDTFELGGDSYYISYEDGGFVIREKGTVTSVWGALTNNNVPYMEITITGTIHNKDKSDV